MESISGGRPQLAGRLFGLVRESQRRTDEFDQAVAGFLSVSRTEARCLDVLHQAGPLAAGELAKRTRLTTSAITKITDRLAGMSYVRRASDPGDRRRVIVALTPKTHRLATSLYEVPDQAMAEFQRRFSDDDLRVLIRYYEYGLHMADLRMSRLQSRLRRRAPRTGPARPGTPNDPRSGQIGSGWLPPRHR
jgi:DNA-binding MarR family transcriptional regulator